MDIPAYYCAPFHESSNRPHLLLGCEPSAIAALFLGCVVLCFSVPTWWGIGGTVVVFVFLRQVLREMAQTDPYLITVHHESQRYNQGFWTAKSLSKRLWRSN